MPDMNAGNIQLWMHVFSKKISSMQKYWHDWLAGPIKGKAKKGKGSKATVKRRRQWDNGKKAKTFMVKVSKRQWNIQDEKGNGEKGNCTSKSSLFVQTRNKQTLDCTLGCHHCMFTGSKQVLALHYCLVVLSYLKERKKIIRANFLVDARYLTPCILIYKFLEHAPIFERNINKSMPEMMRAMKGNGQRRKNGQRY